MPRGIILFADNDVDFLTTRTEFLSREGYLVIAASDLSTARKFLEQDDIDLAILDIRLVDDDDEKDNSGLALAKSIASHKIPKIILTGFPTMDAAREALRPESDTPPLMVDFLAKVEGPQAMLIAVEHALQQHNKKTTSIIEKDRLTEVTLNVPEQLLKDYEAARQHATRIHWVWLALIVGGAVIFLGGVIIGFFGHVNLGIVSAAGGAIAETLGILLTKFAKDANRRWEQFHKELVLFYKKQQR